MRRLLSGLMLVMAVSGILNGQAKEELERQKHRAMEEIQLARELMERTAEKRSSSLQQLRILQRGINSRSALISTLEQEVALLDGEIGSVQDRISELTRENERNREEYKRMVYFAYRNHTSYEKLMYILAGESISQSYQRYKYLKYLSDYRVRKTEEIQELLEQLDQKKEELAGLKEAKLVLLEEKEKEQSKLVSQRTQRASMVDELNREEARLKREIAEKERVARELETRIREVIEEEARRKNASGASGELTSEQMLVGSNFRQNKGRLPWPVDRHIVTMGFGKNEFPGLRGSTINNMGIDIHSIEGTEVKAVFEGEVTKVFPILGANYTVLIRHGEYLSVYQNLVNVRVKGGDRVRSGQLIGEAFTDERNNISQIHFEVYHERSVLDPEEWLRK